MSDDQDEPRSVRPDAEVDEQLDSMPTEESARLRQAGGGGGQLPPDSTCTTGWTFVCDNHPPGQTCITGFTLKCDTGTCTTGWTLRCDATILTCTTGWTFKCDVFG